MDKIMIYTDEDLSQLIACPKRISQPPRQDMRREGQMLRNEMALESLDGQHVFRAFMRQSHEFPENFTVGLDYLPKNEPKSFCLLRCNGMHGGHKAHPHHLNCHIHRGKAEDVNAGLHDAQHIEPTGEYAAFRDALCHFLRLVNVQAADQRQHFPNLHQENLFEREV
jgi:hypothetical protein